MSENQQNIEETAFNSPIPIFIKLKNLIFGENEPPFILKITIYINLTIWLIFQIWHILSYYAINFRDVILEEKKINVEILILNRGNELNYDPSVFLEHLTNFHLISILCWLAFFVGIAFMWRRHKTYIYLIFIPLGIYLIAQFLYMGKEYYINDTTFFDKIVFVIAILNTLFYSVILKNQKSESDSGFFMEN